jgi:hypothetical protein
MWTTAAPILTSICLFLALPALAPDMTDAAHANDSKKADAFDIRARINLVRQMYEKLPPDILGISEPVEVGIAASRTAWGITLRDRDKKEYRFTWWRAGHFSGPNKERLKECGPEESAL